MGNTEIYKASRRNTDLTTYDVIIQEDNTVKLINDLTKEETIYKSIEAVKSEFLLF